MPRFARFPTLEAARRTARDAPPPFRMVPFTVPEHATAGLRLAGELDLAVWDRFDAGLRAAVTTSVRTLIVELGDLEFVDVRSIRRLLETAEELERRGGRLVLRHPRPFLAELVEALGGAGVIERDVRIFDRGNGYTRDHARGPRRDDDLERTR